MNKSKRPNIFQEVESIEGIDKNEETDFDEEKAGNEKHE